MNPVEFELFNTAVLIFHDDASTRVGAFFSRAAKITVLHPH